MSLKHTSPLLGYNNNVRHKGKVFHIQTEDSGVKYGHIMTHLFMDGGRILKSVKTSYAEYIGGERFGDVLREMMKEQHKAMFIALRDGKFDAIADGSAPESQSTKRVEPAPSGTWSTPGGRSDVPSDDPGPISAALGLASSVATGTSPVLQPVGDLPPPPANLLREKTATEPYRIGSASNAPAAPASGPVRVSTPGERRYAPTRPASIFGQALPGKSKTIFGDDLAGDKSLDEVILNYLSEDVDARKK